MRFSQLPILPDSVKSLSRSFKASLADPGRTGADPGFGQGGAQLLRPKVADVVKQSSVFEMSNLWPGSRALKQALEAFGFLMLKYAFSHILEALFLRFYTSILTSEVDKNGTLDRFSLMSESMF